MSIYVPADGPSPCNLAIVGEAPSDAEERERRPFVGPSGRVLWTREPCDLGLVEVMCNRPRASCYVTNVCKTRMPDDEWKLRSLWERDVFTSELIAELDAVQPRLVLAFGRRAALALVPGFTTMPADHGKPTLGATGRYMVMALWHPAAYLRGNVEALGAIVSDLGKVDALLMPALVDLVQPAPAVVATPAEWPAAIAFLAFDGERKTGKCLLCGKGGVASYNGEGLVWKLCKTHAVSSAHWAGSNLPAMREHRDIAVADSAAARLDRTVVRAQAKLREGADKLYGRRADVDGAKSGIEAGCASVLALPADATRAMSGGSNPESTCAIGVSEHLTQSAAISSREG